MNTKFTLFSNTRLNRAKNPIVENIAAYLNGCHTVYESSSFQFMRNLPNISAKVTLPQNVAYEGEMPEYAKIEFNDESVFYYYVTNVRQLAERTLEVELEIDALNTYEGKYSFGSNTIIRRMHRDRFSISQRPESWPVSLDLKYIFDKGEEGITPTLYEESEEYLKDDSEADGGVTNWYLAYMTSESGYPSLYVIPDKTIYLRNPTTELDLISIFPSGVVENNMNAYLLDASISYNGRVYSYDIIAVNKRYTGSVFVESAYGCNKGERLTQLFSYITTQANGPKIVKGHFCYGYAGVQTTDDLTSDFVKILQMPRRELANDANVVLSIDYLDRSLSSIVKVIETPYKTFDIYHGVEADIWRLPSNLSKDDETQFLKSYSLTDNFEDVTLTSSDTIAVPSRFTHNILTINLMASRIKGTLPEPKIYTSPFYLPELVYDSFVLPIRLEEYSPSGQVTLTFKFRQSNACSSANVFSVEASNATKKESLDYSNYLLTNRQNEITLFSSAYLDYMRNGYNYDKKRQIVDAANSAISTVVQMGAGLAGIAASPATGGFSAAVGVGMLSSAASTAVGITQSYFNTEMSIEHTINTTKKQAYNVIAVDDLNLLKTYSRNKAKFSLWKAKDEDVRAMEDFFYFYGYAYYAYGVPNMGSRVWFNFVQCEPAIINEGNVPISMVEEIRARYAEGVTRFHDVMFTDGGLAPSHHWDIAQAKENFERSILPEF